MFLTGKVACCEQMSFSCESQCLLTIQTHVLTCRDIYRVVSALGRRALSDKGDRAVYNDAVQCVYDINDALKVRINVVVDIDAYQ